MRSLSEALRMRAAAHRDRTYLTFLPDDDGSPVEVSFRALDERARAIAAAIQERAERQGRALLLYPPGPEFVEALYGCLHSGWVAVPAYPPDPFRLAKSLPRLLHISADAKVGVVLTTSAFVEVAASLAQEIPGLAGIRWLATDEVRTELAACYREVDCSPEDLAILQYTSGSTSDPRGVMLTHGNLLANGRMIGELFQHTEQTVFASWLPLYHDMGLIGNTLHPLQVGASVVLMSPISFLKKPIRWLRAISRFRATTAGGPNFAYDLCVKKVTPEERQGLDLSSWEVAFNGSEPIRSGTLDRFAETYSPYGLRRSALYPCYGLAEASLIVTGASKGKGPVRLELDGAALQRNEIIIARAFEGRSAVLISSGRPAAGTEVRIVGPDGAELSPGAVGEIWVASDSVGSGYWGREEQSRAVFGGRLAGSDRPFLRTGDLGFVHEGELYITGRAKDLLIVRGANHYPQDIEECAERSHPDIRPGCVAAFGLDDGDREVVVVAAEARERADASDPGAQSAYVAQIGQAVNQAVAQAREVLVERVVVLSPGGLPKTTSGKVQRQACKQQYRSGALAALGEWSVEAPKTDAADFRPTEMPVELEVWLIRRIAETLGARPEAIAVDAPFSTLGLDSARLVALAGELEQKLGRRFEVARFFDHPTVRALAGFLSGAEQRRLAPSRPLAAAASPIAIVGLGCRFPGQISGADQYWEFLRRGGDAIAEIPRSRWNAAALFSEDPDAPGRISTRRAACLEDVDCFDAEFFGISPRLAPDVDPQQRILLEVSYEALQHAGISEEDVAGRSVGVFVGIYGTDYLQLSFQRDPRCINANTGLGLSHAIAANRLSYLLDLRGPSMSVDTACSSSLVAVHLACQSLRSGESEVALAAGVNLMLSPEASISLSKARMLSPDGQCRTFDAEANGYVRGEGCGVVVLKRLSDALAAGDRVLALVRGSGVNQDGRSNGLTAPNGLAQRAVIEQALASAGCAGRDVAYVEAHGTGTPLGDPIEVEALAAVYGLGRAAGEPLRIGSVKTNFGHLEAAAGIAGLVKVVLSLQEEAIPPHLHLHRPNPHIGFEQLGVTVPKELTPWPRREGRVRRAAVSSFGFGGTNAHVVLEEAPQPERGGAERGEAGVQLLCISAKTGGALKALAARYERHLRERGEQSVADVAYTAHVGRTHFAHRQWAVGRCGEELAEALRRFEPEVEVSGRKPHIGFLFSGQGAQRAGAGRELYGSERVFRAALDLCAAAVDSQLPRPLLSVLFEPEGDELRQTRYAQPALFALEWGLAELWRSWGIEPSAVLGHSVGEYVAAAVAGVFSAEDGVRLVAERGALMQALPQEGTMAALRCSERELEEELARWTGRASLAAINAPRSAVVSGEREAVARIAAALGAQGVAHQELQVSHAFHSPLMAPMVAPFSAVAARLVMAKPRVPLASNVTGRFLEGVPGAEYWAEHIVKPVQFAAGIDAMKAAGCDAFLELGPEPVLLSQGRQCIEDPTVGWLASMRSGASEREQMLESLGRLYARGAEVRWQEFHRARGRKVALPTYPFERERFWLQAAADRGEDSKRAAARPGHPLLGIRVDQPPNSRGTR
jgi:acyl transferase domain-containing protein/acyl-CoA synthetase (AMP-forming)/AMP-acid ligase II/acyl carrier protein